MILLGLKMRTEFLYWAYDFIFKLNFLGFFVCLFLKKISRDEPKEYERSSEKNNERNKNEKNLFLLLFYADLAFF